jgi:hypothetical protein
MEVEITCTRSNANKASYHALNSTDDRRFLEENDI